jgi:hypothetical protein
MRIDICPFWSAETRALFEAIKRIDLDMARQALHANAELEARTPDSATYPRQTPLLTAAKKPWLAGVELLIERGADLDAVDEDGWPAAAWACALSEPRLLLMLARAGADLNFKLKHGRTGPMLAAAMPLSMASLQIFADAGVDFSLVDDRGQDALGWFDTPEAKSHGDSAQCRAFIKTRVSHDQIKALVGASSDSGARGPRL